MPTAGTPLPRTRPERLHGPRRGGGLSRRLRPAGAGAAARARQRYRCPAGSRRWFPRRHPPDDQTRGWGGTRVRPDRCGPGDRGHRRLPRPEDAQDHREAAERCSSAALLAVPQRRPPARRRRARGGHRSVRGPDRRGPPPRGSPGAPRGGLRTPRRPLLPGTRLRGLAGGHGHVRRSRAEPARRTRGAREDQPLRDGTRRRSRHRSAPLCPPGHAPLRPLGRQRGRAAGLRAHARGLARRGGRGRGVDQGRHRRAHRRTGHPRPDRGPLPARLATRGRAQLPRPPDRGHHLGGVGGRVHAGLPLAAGSRLRRRGGALPRSRRHLGRRALLPRTAVAAHLGVRSVAGIQRDAEHVVAHLAARAQVPQAVSA